MRLAPAVTGGLIAYSHLHSEWQGLLVFACMLAVITLLRSPQYPLHLIPFASAMLYLLAPPLGAAAAVLISASDGSPSTVTPAHMVAPVLGAWVVTGFGAWITYRFRREREVRVAVIGSHEFARGLEAELEAVGSAATRCRLHRPRAVLRPRRPSPASAASAPWSCCGQTVLDNGRRAARARARSVSAEERESAAFRTAPSRLDVFERVADACLDLPVSMIEAGQLYEELFGHVPLGTTTSAWFQYLLHPGYKRSWPISKRVLDLSAWR